MADPSDPVNPPADSQPPNEDDRSTAGEDRGPSESTRPESPQFLNWHDITRAFAESEFAKFFTPRDDQRKKLEPVPEKDTKSTPEAPSTGGTKFPPQTADDKTPPKPTEKELRRDRIQQAQSRGEFADPNDVVELEEEEKAEEERYRRGLAEARAKKRKPLGSANGGDGANYRDQPPYARLAKSGDKERVKPRAKTKPKPGNPPVGRISRIAAGGLFALFFGAFIQVLTLHGVITMNSGHLFMFIAFVAGALLLTTEVLPVKPRRQKVLSVLILGLVLLSIDLASVFYVRWRDNRVVEGESKSEPFSVELRSAIFSDSGPLTLYMVGYPSMFGDTASPIFYLTYIRVTNLQGIPRQSTSLR